MSATTTAAPARPRSARRRPPVALLGAGVVLLLAVLLPFYVTDYWTVFATRVALLSVAAIGFNIVWGYCGVLSFGQAVFFGWAAYVFGLLATKHGVTSLPLCLLVGAGVGAGLSAVIGVFLFVGKRRVGLVYVAVATLAASYVSQELAGSWHAVGAANGLPPLPLPTLGGTVIEPGRTFYFIALALVVLVTAFVWWLMRTPLGDACRALRSDEVRTAHLGYNVARIKVTMFVLAGALTGASGALYGMHSGFVGPELVGTDFSTQFVLWVVLGGAGTVAGPLVGTGLYQYADSRLGDLLPTQWPVAFGLLLLLVVIAAPDGLVGLWRRARSLVRRKDVTEDVA